MMKMRNFFCSAAILISCVNVAHADIIPMPTLDQLNKVTLQLSAEDWASTKTAKVIVQVNASLTSAELGQVHTDLLDKLNQLARSASWHITDFIRSQDQSGLERLQVTAEARLPEAELANLRDTAKKISKAGETFIIQDIQFTPTLAEVESVRNALRTKLYNSALEELNSLNKVFPLQHYSLHTIDFMTSVMPMQANYMMNNRAMAMDRVAAVPAAEPIVVSDKVQVTAVVILASPTQTKIS